MYTCTRVYNTIACVVVKKKNDIHARRYIIRLDACDRTHAYLSRETFKV